ncbi:carboxypeptidase-like regulatory domain-containing protein [Sphingobacterium daejeonense]|uniref:carboxypeptidase-like regulatory domain-containing protein n=1 Tax=Sphingobacterium daejeonense TaxID=371142 RepID=UPI0010C2D560|nr:carboxypeptidase-like regulatory domain-containing protein [Sphingobacterium daejeonense]VTQ04703.1 TonB-linked outer membrane protein, SusC/RagA family [Sphingobacterium daejeonense]
MKNFRTYFKLSLLVFLCNILQLQVLAQESTVMLSGKVLDEQQNPIKEVIISSQNNKIGTSTNWEGTFDLEIPLSIEELKFERIGYSTQIVNIQGGDSTLIVVLKTDNHQLDKIIDLGYSNTTFGDLTGAVSIVQGDVLERHPVANLSQTFAGRLAGLTTQETFF